MLKRFIIIVAVAIIHTNIAFAMNLPASQIKNKLIEPDATSLAIIGDTLSALKTLRKQSKPSAARIKKLIEGKILPHIDIKTSTQLTLKKHWNNLNNKQKIFFQNYISNALIRDYGGILNSYEQLDNVDIDVTRVKRKGNKAIVRLVVNLDNQPKPFHLSLKLIFTDKWRIYDMVFSGVSLMKNYQAQFTSHIKRKGLDSLIKKVSHFNKP